jgi:excisionase family DNA binding protein
VQIPREAAEALGVSVDMFDRYVRRQLRMIYVGRLRLVSVAELERWAESSSTPVIE